MVLHVDEVGEAQHTINAYAMQLPDSELESQPDRDDTIAYRSNVFDALWRARPVAPAVLTSAAAAKVAGASLDLLHALEELLKIPEARAVLARMSGYPSAALGLLSDTLGEDPFIFGRTDVILNGDSIAISELNVTSRLGFLFEHDLMTEELERSEAFSQIVKTFRLRAHSVLPSVKGIAQRAFDSRGEGKVGVVCSQSPEVRRRLHYLPELVRCEFSRQGLQTFVCSISDIVPYSGGIKHPRFGQIRLMYRLFGPDDLSDSAVSIETLRGSISSGALKVIDGFLGESFVTKLPLILLSDAYWLSKLPNDLAESVARSVPWTCLLDDSRTEKAAMRVEVIPYALTHRETLVLKPGMGSGGIWVIVGAEVSQRRWEAAITSALRSKMPWVIQEFAEPHIVPVLSRNAEGEIISRDCVTNYCAVLVNHQCAGLMRRESFPESTRILNALRGASAVPLYLSDIGY